jgi:3-hydroxyacyl-CoA dehydrogenase
MTTIGIIGSGHVGTSLASAAITHGYDVVLSNSRGPDSLADLVAELGPKARAAGRADRHPGRVMRGRDSSGILAADPEDPDDLWPSSAGLPSWS